MVAVLLSITGVSLYLGAAVVARHRAQAAADLAALAAAARLAAGPATACARAKVVAREMRTSPTGCAVDDLDVVVTVEVRRRRRRVGQRAGRRPRRPGRPGLAAAWIGIGQARVGEFGRCGQPQ